MARPRSSGERPPTPLAWTAERGAPGNPIPRLGELRRTPSRRSSQNSFKANFRECPKDEVRRIPIPRTPVNKLPMHLARRLQL